MPQQWRITTINSPSTVTPVDIKNSRSGNPGSSALKESTPTSTTHAAAIAQTMAFTHTREASVKMRSFLTKVSSFQVDTITT